MRKYIAIIALCTLTIVVKGQEISVEKVINEIQTGFLGIWGHNESKLTNEISLRSEIGFDSEIFGGSFYSKTGIVLVPVITLEPRWYYNLKKRDSKSKNIKNNSGNYIALKTSYYPDWFVISNYDNLSLISQIYIIPRWGIRRTIGNHFNFETGVGLAYRYVFAKSAGYTDNESEILFNINLRIGYTF